MGPCIRAQIAFQLPDELGYMSGEDSDLRHQFDGMNWITDQVTEDVGR